MENVTKVPVKESVNDIPKVRFDLTKYRETLSSIQEQLKVSIAITLLILASYCPQVLAPEGSDEDIICLVDETTTDQIKTITISCNDQEQTEVTLEFFINNYDVGTYSEETVSHPPSSEMEYVTTEFNPNYNCHSYTLQNIQERYGIDLGASATTWLQNGLDTFVREFGEEVTSGYISRLGAESTLDSSLIMPGDVILYYRHDGSLLHSGFVSEITDEGRIVTANKLGQEAVIESTIEGIAWYYELDGEYDEELNIGGGHIQIYRLDQTALATLSG